MPGDYWIQMGRIDPSYLDGHPDDLRPVDRPLVAGPIVDGEPTVKRAPRFPRTHSIGRAGLGWAIRVDDDGTIWRAIRTPAVEAYAAVNRLYPYPLTR